MPGRIILTVPNYYEDSHCGYCGADGSRMLGFLCPVMSCSDYKALMDLGFRRSGTFFYKPDLKRSCCQSYTIRMDVDKFKVSGEQRKCIKNLYKFLGIKPEKNKKKNQPYDFDQAMNLLKQSEISQDNLEHGPGLKVELKTAEFTEERYLLYKKYQISVHNDSAEEVSEAQFKSFLCDSPLKQKNDGHIYGSKHQLYYYRNKLIAFGVVDVLPGAVSSVYFVRDPDMDHLMLGKVGALFEIDLAREMSKNGGGDGVWGYYLGFYIENCQKMRYKGHYKPAYLLDPETTYKETADATSWRLLEEYQEEFARLEDPQSFYVSFKHGNDLGPEGSGDNYDHGKWRRFVRLFSEAAVESWMNGSTDLVVFSGDASEVSMDDIPKINGRLSNRELVDVLIEESAAVISALFPAISSGRLDEDGFLNCLSLFGVVGPGLMSRMMFV